MKNRKQVDEIQTRTFEVYGVLFEVTCRQTGWETPGNLSGRMDDAEEYDCEVEDVFVGLRIRSARGPIGTEWVDHSHALEYLGAVTMEESILVAPFSAMISLGVGSLLDMLWNGDPNKSLYPFKEIK
jgi:hypothetical protein